ncbi:MAG: HAD family phosphatase, partial [Alphaproteobacteria bacterium]|nr:HAD family phosphatase [Alphaproteobacteria bacterium]
MKNVKAIIFDLGGVILNINYQKTITQFKNLGVITDDSYFSKSFQTDVFNQIETGKISEEEFLLELQKKNTAISIQKLKNAWNAMLLNLPHQRIDLLKKIKEKFSIYLLSNTNTIHIAEFKRQLGPDLYHEFYNLFDKIYYSHEIGFRKPDPKAFQIILEE